MREPSAQKPAPLTWPFPPIAAISHRAPWEGSAQGLGCDQPSNAKLTEQGQYKKCLWKCYNHINPPNRNSKLICFTIFFTNWNLVYYMYLSFLIFPCLQLFVFSVTSPTIGSYIFPLAITIKCLKPLFPSVFLFL